MKIYYLKTSIYALSRLLEAAQCQHMIGEDAHGLFARLRSSVTNRFTKWSKSAAISEDDSELTLDKVAFLFDRVLFNFVASIRCKPLQSRRRHRIGHPSLEPAVGRAKANRRRLVERSSSLTRSDPSPRRALCGRSKSNYLCPFIFVRKI